MPGAISRRTTLHGLGGAGVAGIVLANDGIWRRALAAQDQATPEMMAGWDAFDQRLAELAPRTAVLAAELIDGECHPIHAQNADQPLASGSNFKLFILGELARQVEAGEVDWEDLLAIEDRYKSVPHGDLRTVPDGAEFTIRYLAERMIQVSDNTATDHLLHFLGRENVERMMETMGVADPALNIPLFSTREFALLKLAVPTEELDAYMAAAVAERRRILAEEIDTMPLSVFDTVPDQTSPTEIERAEWLFTREDLCRAMAALQAMSERPGLKPVTEILSLETQIPFDPEIWPYAGFKGGSELGVLSGAWLLQRADGRRFVYTVAFNDPAAGLDTPAVIATLEAGRDLLAETP